MGKYDEKYEIRRANYDDIQSIADFMDHEWKQGGILSNPAFLQYEFSSDDGVNFILAIHKERKTIQGLWGYYPLSKNKEALDVAGGPWKVKQDKDNIPFLGNEILMRAKQIIGYRTILGVGDNPRTSGIYHSRIKKDLVQKLNHFYRMNDELSPRIALIKNSIIQSKYLMNSHIEFKKMEHVNDIDAEFWESIDTALVPYKDSWYINKRFFHHPVYKYDIIGIYDCNELKALIVLRKVDANESSILRIVDFIGDKQYIQWIGRYVDDALQVAKCEYIDFYNYGLDESLLKNAGFVRRADDGDVNIIPNYFEPFEQRNVDIYFSSPVQEVTICKADGDQDRPNHM